MKLTIAVGARGVSVWRSALEQRGFHEDHRCIASRATAWPAAATAAGGGEGVVGGADEQALHLPRLVGERDYLLSTTHPIGRFEVVVFAMLGFSADRWEQLEASLRDLLVRSDARPAGEARHGRDSVVSGRLVGPSGQGAAVVAAYPEERT